MKVRVFSVFDKKARLYNPPVFFVTLGQALRWFGDLLSDKAQLTGKHPEDFELVAVAEFDDESAVFGDVDHVRYDAGALAGMDGSVP